MKKLRNLSFLKSSIDLHIDYVFESNGGSYLSGWIIDRSSNKPPIFNLSSDKKKITAHLAFFARPDVVESRAVENDTAFCSGVIIAFKNSWRDSVVLEVNGNRYSVSESKLKQVDSFDELYSSIAEGDRPGVVAKIQSAMGITTVRGATKEITMKAVPKEDMVIHVDICARVGDYIYLNGWILDSHHQIRILQLMSTEASPSGLLEQVVRYPRSDLQGVAQKHGLDFRSMGFFVAIPWVDTDESVSVCYGPDEESLVVSEHKVGSLPGDEIQITKFFLNSLDVYGGDFASKASVQIRAMLAAVWQDRLNQHIDAQVTEYGTCSESPRLSLIIPIYGRYDFIQHQLLQFSRDPEFQHYEIIYVLDDPAIYREFTITCYGAYETFRLPFKTVYGGSNLGFAGANNLGVSVATAPMLLLLNSDILPASAGWLGSLLSTYATLENVGILGGKLLYEDGTIQHMGMEFAEDSFYPGIWMNYHPFKGFPDQLTPQCESKEVELVTGACMLLQTELYRQVGGFDTGYLLGDFEDSDLCMKVRDTGRTIYVDGKVCLYHLERQSQSLVDAGDWKFKLTLLNGMRQKEKWDARIKGLKNVSQ